MSDLGSHIGAVAQALWGEPNRRMSTPGKELRYGTNGSRSVDLQKGTWFDHEAEEGGGVLDLIKKEKGLVNGRAFEFMRSLGLPLDPPQPRHEPKPEPKPAQESRVVATYDYVDEDGELLFQVVRMEPKTFRQRRPRAEGGWDWSVKGSKLVPYRYPELIDDLAHDRTIFVVEGEKAVDFLRSKGVPATTNPMGAGKWPAEFADLFKGADVVIARDNNDVGRKHGVQVAENLAAVAKRVRLLDAPGIPEKAGLDDWMADNFASVDALYTMTERQAFAPGQEPVKSKFGALWLHEIAGHTPNTAWVVKRVIPGKGFGGIVGEPGCGKSFLALDLGFHVGVLARNNPDSQWFGHRVNHGGVVYIAAEGQAGFVKRVAALMGRYKVEHNPNTPFVLLPTAVDLRSPEGDTDGLIAEIKAHSARMDTPLSLIFVDTLNRVLAGGEENSSEDMGAFIRNCDKIKAATGATVVVVHHMNAGATRERGHSSFRGALDFKLDVEKGEAGNSWRITKQKDDEDGAVFGFSLGSVTVGVDEDGDAVTSCVVEPSDQTNEAARKGKKLPDSAVLAYRALIDCCNGQGRGVPIMGLKVVGVTLRQWAEWMRRNEVPDTSDEAFRKAMKRAQEALQMASKIGVQDGYVWPVHERSR